MSKKLDTYKSQLSKYIEAPSKVDKIIKSIDRYCIEYVNSNNIHYLKDAIFENKFNDILSAIIKYKTFVLIIIKDEYDIDNIAYITIENIIPELQHKFQVKEKYAVDSDGYKCIKCESTNCIQQVKQTRAADEPPDIVIQCMACGFKKKM